MRVWGSTAGNESNFPAHMAEKDDVRDTGTEIASPSTFLFKKYLDSVFFFFELDAFGCLAVLREAGLRAVVLWVPASAR